MRIQHAPTILAGVSGGKVTHSIFPSPDGDSGPTALVYPSVGNPFVVVFLSPNENFAATK